MDQRGQASCELATGLTLLLSFKLDLERFAADVRDGDLSQAMLAIRDITQVVFEPAVDCSATLPQTDDAGRTSMRVSWTGRASEVRKLERVRHQRLVHGQEHVAA